MTELNFQRHRRLRKTAGMRNMVRETYLHKEDLIYPIFVAKVKILKMKCLLCQVFFNFHLII